MSLLTRWAKSSVTLTTIITSGVALVAAPALSDPPPGKKAGNELERVVLVSGGDTAASNGQALLEAFDEVALGEGPCSDPGPSAAAPCLVKLGPGIFDLVDSLLFMVDHVDLAGSGEGVTVITGATPDTGAPALLTGANAELRYLTVENTQFGNGATPIRAIITGGSDMRISHVTAMVSGGGNLRAEAIAVAGGLGGAPVMRHVTAVAGPDATGNYRAITVSDNSDVELIGVDARSSGTALALLGEDDDTVTLHGSQLSGNLFSITVPGFGSAPDKTVDIHASQLAGTVSALGSNTMVSLGASQLDGSVAGSVFCVFVYNASFAPHLCN